MNCEYCGNKIEGYGHNGSPLVEGKVCDSCQELVIAERLRNYKEFKTWRDIHDWADSNGYKAMAKRMRINNQCWNSSGEFGRSQVAICDAMRFADTEEERHAIAKDIEKECQADWFYEGEN